VKQRLNEKADSENKQKLQDPLRKRFAVHVFQQNKSKKSAYKTKPPNVYSVKPEQVPEIVKK